MRLLVGLIVFICFPLSGMQAFWKNMDTIIEVSWSEYIKHSPEVIFAIVQSSPADNLHIMHNNGDIFAHIDFANKCVTTYWCGNKEASYSCSISYWLDSYVPVSKESLLLHKMFQKTPPFDQH